MRTFISQSSTHYAFLFLVNELNLLCSMQNWLMATGLLIYWCCFVSSKWVNHIMLNTKLVDGHWLNDLLMLFCSCSSMLTSFLNLIFWTWRQTFLTEMSMRDLVVVKGSEMRFYNLRYGHYLITINSNMYINLTWRQTTCLSVSYLA